MSEEPAKSAQLDHLHTALVADDRRAVLAYFYSSEADVASFEDLVEFLSARDGQPDDRDPIAIELHHATLPKLADLGLLDYDARTKTARCPGHPRLSEWWDSDS